MGLTGDTRVITHEGTVSVLDTLGQAVPVLLGDGSWSEIKFRCIGERPVATVEMGRYGEKQTVCTTLNTHWPLRPKAKHFRVGDTTIGLRVGDRLDYAFPQRPDGLVPSMTGVARGFVFGDGSANASRVRSAALFCGPKDEVLLPYFTGLGRMPRRYLYLREATGSRYVPVAKQQEVMGSGADYGQILRINGLPIEWKTEYPSLSDPCEVYGWLAGYFAADGDVGITGRPSINSAERSHILFYKRACLALGIWTYDVRERTKSGYAAEGRSYSMGLSRADLDSAFLIHPAHRERWEANVHAAERRGWTVRSVQVEPTRAPVYVVDAPVDRGVTLAGHVLVGASTATQVDDRYAPLVGSLGD